MRKKRSLSILLTTAITVAGITPVQLMPPKKAAAEVTLSNPRTDAEGVSTWDCIYFGNYWQNDTNGDGRADQKDEKEPIKWRVLSVEGDDAFLLADCSLDCQPYNTKDTGVTWETCTLRSWLNGYGSDSNACGTDYRSDNFIDAAFSPLEQAAIRDTVVVNEDNPYYGTEGGNDTTDKVYLLSLAEVCTSSYGFPSEYHADSDTRISVNTAYAKGQGADTGTYYTSLGSSWWWLRSPGYYSSTAANVNSGGCGYSYGYYVNFSYSAVRPALHLNLKASSDVLSSNLYTYARIVSFNRGSTVGSRFKDSAGAAYVVVKSGTSNGEVAYAAPKNKKIKSATVPAEVMWNGTAYKVTSIWVDAFKNCKRLKKVTIGKNIRVIGKKAFYGCAGLKNITIKTTKLTQQSVGSKAFAKLHKKAECKVPKKKVSSYKKLLKKKGLTGKKQRIKS